MMVCGVCVFAENGLRLGARSFHVLPGFVVA